MHRLLLSLRWILMTAAWLHAQPLFADTAHPSVRQLAMDSKSIVVGTVVNSKCVLNEKGVIVTKTQIKVLHSVTRPRSVGSVIEVTQLGGELDGKSFDVSEHTRFDIGATYLLFLEDPSRAVIPATLGGVHGCMRIVRGDDGVSYPVMSGYRPVTGVQGGRFDYARRATSLVNGVATLAAAEPSRAVPNAGVPGNDIVTAIDTNISSAKTLEEVLACIYAERGEQAGTSPVLRGLQMLPVFESNGLTLCVCGEHELFLVYEQVPAAWVSHAHNELAMGRYNLYFDVHRYTADDGSWNSPNFEDEFCGFTSSADLTEVYGAEFAWGTSTLAMNVAWSIFDCGEIWENDIHFNPAFRWTYALDDVVESGGSYLYASTVMHELGHSHGLEAGTCDEDYSFDRPSVMCAGSRRIVEDGKGLHRRDALMLRLNYADQGSKGLLMDMGVESWWMDGSIRNSTLSPTTIAGGQILTLSNVFVENMSTADVSNVRLRVYLSKNTTISNEDILLGTSDYFGTFPHNSDWRGNLTRTIPPTVENGVYFVGVVVSSDEPDYGWWDDYMPNNRTYFSTPITVLHPTSELPGDNVPFHLSLGPQLSTRFFADTTRADLDPAPPSCANAGAMSSSIFLDFIAPEDGTLEIAREPSDANGLVDAPDVVAIYAMNAQGIPPTLLHVGCSTDTNVILIRAIAGTNYLIRIGGTELGGVSSWYRIAINPTRPFGSVPELASPWTSAQPENNLNMLATTMSLPCAQSTSYGKWFEYVAPVNGTVYASTCRPNTDFLHSLSIHSVGPNMTTLDCGISGDFCGNPAGANASATVTAGQRILLRVASTTQARGNFELHIKFTPQDDNAGGCAQMATVPPGVYHLTTVGANRDVVPTCTGFSGGERATWLRVVPSVTGKLIATTCADFGGETQDEPRISIYQGTCSSLVPVSCDNFECSSAGAIANVTANTAYAIRFSGGSGPGLPGATASGKLAILVERFCMGDFDNDGFVLASDLAVVLNAWGETASVADLNGDEIVDGSDLAILLDAWGPCE